MTQAHIFYTGMVQGVGFRYIVQRYADQLAVTGWVRNLSDGRVEITAEGSRENIEELIRHIERYFESSIKDKRIDFLDTDGQYQDFRITR